MKSKGKTQKVEAKKPQQDPIKQQNPQFDEKNIEKTQKLQTEAKYYNYVKWIKENGGRFKHIEFPSAFGETGYTGISALETLPANKAIVAIPKKLIITRFTVYQISELKEIISHYSFTFDIQSSSDAEYNILILFLIYEKFKGDNSFYWPMFQVCEKSQSYYHWNTELRQECQDIYLLEEQEEMDFELKQTFKQFQKIFMQNKKIFGKELVMEEFIWAYEFVTTRCYGYYLPGLMLIPLAEFFNHGRQDVQHDLLSLSREKTSNNELNYVQKSNKIDLELLLGQQQQQEEQKSTKIQQQYQNLYDYVDKNKQYLQDADHKRIQQWEFLNITEIQKLVDQVNYERLKRNTEEDIFSIPWYENDCESDCDEEEEQFEDVKKIQQDKQLILREKNQEQNNIEKDDKYDWPWYQIDNDIYFIVSTTTKIEKGQQLYNWYGNRSNRFLLLNYGFSLDYNPYDSVYLRFWVKIPEDKITDKQVGKLIFDHFVSNNDWSHGIGKDKIGDNQLFLTEESNQKKKLDPKEMLTDLFRLKSGNISNKLLIHLRTILQVAFKQEIVEDNYLSKPVSLEYEMFIFDFYEQIVQELIKKKKTSLEEDKQLLKLKLSQDMRFAIQYRKGIKEILVQQLKLVKIVKTILGKVKNGINLKVAYMEKIPECEESSLELISNRNKIKNYLAQLNELFQKKA